MKSYLTCSSQNALTPTQRKRAVLHIIYIENPVELINFLDLCALRDCYLFLSAHHCTDPANNITQHNITYLKITSTRINTATTNTTICEKLQHFFFLPSSSLLLLLLQDDIKAFKKICVLVLGLNYLPFLPI